MAPENADHLGLAEMFFHLQACMTDTQPIPLATSSSGDERSILELSGLLNAPTPDRPWEGHVTIASIFDMVGAAFVLQ